MRLFFALPLPGEARQALGPTVEGLKKVWPGLSWVGEDDWHITLAFLGEQGKDGREAAMAALARLAEYPCPPPLLSFGGLGVYPPRGPWKVLVVELAPPKATDLVYTLLNTALSEEAGKRGLPALNPEWPDPLQGRSGRPFRAHVTLARRRRTAAGFSGPGTLAGGGLDSAALGLAASGGGGWPFEACLLYKSDLRPEGAAYTELGRAVFREGWKQGPCPCGAPP